jgi:hypothetical protein
VIESGSQSHRRSNKGNESCGLASSRLELHVLAHCRPILMMVSHIYIDSTVAESTPLQFGVSLTLSHNVPYCFRNRYWRSQNSAPSQPPLSLIGFQPMAVNVASFHSGKLCSNVAHYTQTLVIPTAQPVLPLSPASELFIACRSGSWTHRI